MPLFKRGDTYLVYVSEFVAFTYSDTGGVSRTFDPTLLLKQNGREWKPVYDDAAIPAGLIPYLILKFPS